MGYTLDPIMRAAAARISTAVISHKARVLPVENRSKSLNRQDTKGTKVL
jgi:hypothetical protein